MLVYVLCVIKERFVLGQATAHSKPRSQIPTAGASRAGFAATSLIALALRRAIAALPCNYGSSLKRRHERNQRPGRCLQTPLGAARPSGAAVGRAAGASTR